MSSNSHSSNYDRKTVAPGIVHLGVGNFHRAHMEDYLDSLLEKEPSQKKWGVSGAMLLPSDKALYEALKSQDGEYTLTIRGRDGKDGWKRIRSLVDLNWAGDNADEILKRLASPDTKIISMTITEGGYNIDRNTGEFDLENLAVAEDIANPQSPKTAFGFVAEGLRRRKDAGNGPVTILTCDNLQHNGDTARKAFMTFIKAQDPALAEWAESNVSFPNSMVDRITPATRPEDREALNKKNGTDDAAPVFCEDFIQWVIEDKFAAGRPAWEEVGVEMTDDVSAYENMKLSLLNASHTLLSYPAFLAGYRKVDEAMKDDDIRSFARQYMDLDATPYVPAPGNTNLDEYKTTLIERFGNPSVSDQVARLCMDGLSKFPVYVVPVLAKMLADGKDLKRMAYLLAAYRKYLRAGVDDKGQTYEIIEPWLTPGDKKLIDSDNPLDFLKLPAFAGAPLSDNDKFVKLYLNMVKAIDENGAKATLKTILE
ncbi:MAG: mannitol dehydrogenase family protein [Desulfovibrio sp.]|nr:mannitol dehydrogenase family protein [Desulfovibrio sp.]